MYKMNKGIFVFHSGTKKRSEKWMCRQTKIYFSNVEFHAKILKFDYASDFFLQISNTNIF